MGSSQWLRKNFFSEKLSMLSDLPMIGLRVVESCSVTRVKTAIQTLRWNPLVIPRCRQALAMSLKPNPRQIIHRAVQRRPKNRIELLEVENSQTTGAKPTSSKDSREMAQSKRPNTV